MNTTNEIDESYLINNMDARYAAVNNEEYEEALQGCLNNKTHTKSYSKGQYQGRRFSLINNDIDDELGNESNIEYKLYEKFNETIKGSNGYKKTIALPGLTKLIHIKFKT